MGISKRIRKSRRGLTFSFPSNGSLSIGCHFDYIIDGKKEARIRIVPAEDGRFTISRKRSGEKWLSLVDLRNREVLSAISDMEQICIRVDGDQITVYDAAAQSHGVEKKSSILLHFPRIELARMRKASGMDDASAVGALLDGVQITLDDYLTAGGYQQLSLPSLHSELADVYTLVSLFSGAGILDWPFKQDDRFQIQYAIDYDVGACETYRRNIGTHIVHGDIHKAFTDDGYPLDTMVTEPDAVIGGPSCKPFSNANRHTRLADHKDSDLVAQYMRIVKVLRPKVFAMENVPAVLTACDGAYFQCIQEAAAELGYDLDARIVQDNKVGGFTTRRRAIILGSRVGKAVCPGMTLAAGSMTAGDALRKVDSTWSNFRDVTVPGAETKRRMSFVPQGGNYTSIPEEYRTGSKNRHSCTYRRLAMDEPSPTIVNWRKRATCSATNL